MKISIESNIKETRKTLGLFQRHKLPVIVSESINEVGVKAVNAMRSQLAKKLDRPTKFTVTSPRIFLSKPVKNPFATVFIHKVAAQYLEKLFEGGIKTGAKKIPVPYTLGGTINLNDFGNIRGKKSGLVKRKTEFIGEVKGITGVWRRVGGKRNPKLKLLIGFKNSVQYKKTLEFYKTIRGVVKNNIEKILDKKTSEAMRRRV